ncbi:SRPBCC family protein [Amycolatopsis acidiphila]|uniref:Carbon monoxide dehydrogenase n=1 Tax=Amycolatopsis acidiphila TaxID=715473 RepID=A0A558AM77_9PSEU|nr:SRPBCC family protein [Amycolatopsis acidiphila]TVT25359.1 carbon monoxide dehydrogenase [Amycolatopsis acidiphila]UIJ62490.1 SRPBCC family protein [Amycolatopsis acidiphila]
MDLSNTFTVNLPVEDTWKVLTDLERVAPCLPGAALLGVEGDAYRGAVKIKVGPVSAQYQGIARFVEKDDQAYRAVIRAEGKDVGGQGNAAATVTATLTQQGDGTKVDVRTDLALSGRVAQFGRGVIADVSNKLLGQFVRRLEDEFASGGATTPTAAAKPVDLADVEPLDVMSSMGGTIAKRAIPAAGALLALIVGILLARKGRRVPSAQAPVVINLSFPALSGRPDSEEATR